jgi:hypothetical protein
VFGSKVGLLGLIHVVSLALDQKHDAGVRPGQTQFRVAKSA